MIRDIPASTAIVGYLRIECDRETGKVRVDHEGDVPIEVVSEVRELCEQEDLKELLREAARKQI